MRSGWRNAYDDVRGVIIGDVDKRQHYSFHTETGEMFDTGDFHSDREAADYVAEKWPRKFKEGVEMRCYEELP